MIGPGKGPLQLDIWKSASDNGTFFYLWCHSNTSVDVIEKIAIVLSDVLFADGIKFSLIELVPFIGGGVRVYGTCDEDGLINASVEKRARTHFEAILKERGSYE